MINKKCTQDAIVDTIYTTLDCLNVKYTEFRESVQCMIDANNKLIENIQELDSAIADLTELVSAFKFNIQHKPKSCNLLNEESSCESCG